jgi:hypothetical protein
MAAQCGKELVEASGGGAAPGHLVGGSYVADHQYLQNTSGLNRD